MYCSQNCRLHAQEAYHRTECKISFGLEVMKKYEYTVLNGQGIQFGDTEYFKKLSTVSRLGARALLLGTEQGSQLENLMKRITLKDIFKEKVDPRNEKFNNDYLSALRMSRSFDALFPPETNLTNMAVKIIMELRRLSFFKNSSDRSNEVSFLFLKLT